MRKGSRPLSAQIPRPLTFKTGDKSAARVLVHIQRLFWIERALDRRRKARNIDLAAYESLRAGIRQRRSTRVVKRIFGLREGP
jgi:hypothetical protein